MADRECVQEGGADGRVVELLPARWELPMLPRLERDATEKRTLRGIRTNRFLTKPTTMLESERSQREMVQEHLDRYARGERRAIPDLLRLDPDYDSDPRVRAAVRDYVLRAGPGRGRPRGPTPTVLERALGVVRVVEGLHVTTELPKKSIFSALAEQGFENLSEDELQHYFYRYRRHPSLRPRLSLQDAPPRRLRVPEGFPDSGFLLSGVEIGCDGAVPRIGQLRISPIVGGLHLEIHLG